MRQLHVPFPKNHFTPCFIKNYFTFGQTVPFNNLFDMLTLQFSIQIFNIRISQKLFMKLFKAIIYSINRIYQILVIFISVIHFLVAQSQSVDLQQVLNAYQLYHPSTRIPALIDEKTMELHRAIQKQWLPQYGINGSATYQSDVTKIALPALPGIPPIQPLSKDQYKFTLDAQQMIYDGGAIGLEAKRQSLTAQNEKFKAESEIRLGLEQLIRAYFSVCIQEGLLHVVKNQLHEFESLELKMQNLYAQGLLSGMQFKLLKAERIRLQQKQSELLVQKEQFIQIINQWTQSAFSLNSEFILPSSITPDTSNYRPELNSLKTLASLADLQEQQAQSKLYPKLNAFAQGGYGRPGLNFLNNDFDWFYLFGGKVTIPLSTLNTLSNEKKIARISKEIVKEQESNFLLNIQTQYKSYLLEISKLNQWLQQDKELIALRKDISTAARAQWEQGITTQSDYIKEQEAEANAREQQAMHSMQLILHQYLIQILFGTTLK